LSLANQPLSEAFCGCQILHRAPIGSLARFRNSSESGGSARGPLSLKFRERRNSKADRVTAGSSLLLPRSLCGVAIEEMADGILDRIRPSTLQRIFSHSRRAPGQLLSGDF